MLPKGNLKPFKDQGEYISFVFQKHYFVFTISVTYVIANSFCLFTNYCPIYV